MAHIPFGKGNVKAVFSTIPNANDFAIIKDEIWLAENIYENGIATEYTTIHRCKIVDDELVYNAIIQEQRIGIHYNVGKSVLDYVKNQEDFAFVDGYVALPKLPGLGVDVNKELVLEENKNPTTGRILYGTMPTVLSLSGNLT